MSNLPVDIQRLIVKPGKKVNLKNDFDPGFRPDIGKVEGREILESVKAQLADFQERLYAENTRGVLILFQALDAAGKDGTIKHVMSGVNPQGCQVFSFKAPSSEEIDHDFLWRSSKALPERGRFGIFNRSYYEEVLVVRVHQHLLKAQSLPPELVDKDIWKRRFRQINDFERYLSENGIEVIKFFLNVSKAEQKRRFLERIDRPEKNWKFSEGDVRERAHWDDYQKAYEELFNNTSTEVAPWYVIPADAKWFTRLAVSAVLLERLGQLNPQFPQVSEAHREALQRARQQLMSE